jgi:hypothetical protein
MKIKSAKSFRYWYKTKIREIDRNDPTHNENFVGTYHRENGKKTIKGFFEMYHGDKPDIASYLPSILKIAEDGQAIYEFLQNAVDSGSTHFYIFYNEKYFLAINNGSPFDIEGLQSILNIAQTTKKDPDKIGRFGIGFKLAHRLVGKNEGTDELVKQYKGPILFSWAKLEDLESLLNNEQIEPITPQKGVNNGFFDAPYLLKLLLTNFPSDPDETVKDINYKDQVLFKQEELKELIDFLNENFKIHSDSLKKNVLKQGSLFFIKLGEDKKKLLDKDYSELVNGIQYSMNTLKNLQKVYINNDDIGKIPLQLEAGTIKKGSDEFERISPEYEEFDIKFAIGFNTIKFGNDKSYEQIKLLKEKPNFYKYFPMGDEINGFGFIVHCDSFSNEANRRKLHEDDINRNLFPELAKHIIQRLTEYKTKDKSKFLNLYASLLLSDIPDRQNNKWLRPIFYDTLLSFLQNNVPTKNGFSGNAQNVKINKLKIPLNLSDFGLSQIEWFEWENETDKLLIDEATKSEKLGIEEWDIRDIIENANLERINEWIANRDRETYELFLAELEKIYLREETIKKLFEIKLFKFSDSNFYSINDVWTIANERETFQEKTYNQYRKAYELTTRTRVVQKRILNKSIIFSTDKTINISNELQNLGFAVSLENISSYKKIYSALSEKLPKEEDIYNAIAEKCKTNTLTPEEKKDLFHNFTNEATKFDNVAEGTLKDLHLFCDIQGNIKPLSELVSSSLQSYAWLYSYKIKSDEYFKDLNSYLIQGDELFDEIILPNIEIIKDELTEAKEIKELVTFFKENHRPFFNEFIIQKQAKGYSIIDKSDKHQIVPPNKATREFIDKHLSDNLIVLPYDDFSDFNNEDGIIKGESLHSIILDLVDVDEHKEILVNIAHYKEEKILLLQKLSEIRLVSKEQYEKESYEYKVLELACEVIKDKEILNFKKKIIIETEDTELSLSEIPPFTDKIKIEDYELNLAKLLPDNYENSAHLSSLINQFIGLGLSKERIGDLFGVSEEPELSNIFQLFSEQVEKLENADQLAFAILYNKHIEEIDLKSFKVLTKGGSEYNLTYNFYNKQFNFLLDGATLDDKYKGIKKILKELPFDISDENKLLEEPCFLEKNFFCPDLITENLTEEQKISFVDFLFNQWDKKNKKTVIKTIDWSKIEDVETKNILGFNPITSVYPSKYACESEALPDYLINWLGKEESKIEFLKDLGIWTETSAIVELRKYLSGKIKIFHNNSLAQETRFNEDETVLFNSFKWIKEKEIVLKTAEQFETFKKAVGVINDNRGNNNDLRIEEDFDFDELAENSTEWKEPYYVNWKEVSNISISLYDGELPKSVSLDEIEEYVFYYFYDGNTAIDGANNIYINVNSDIKKELRKLELDDDNFDFDGLWQNKLEVLEKENALLRKSNEATLGTEFSTDISKNDQKEANREAKEIVKEKLEKEGFEFTEEIGKYSTIDGVFKDDIEFPLVVKSYKYQDEPLKIGANEWIQLMKPNSMFWLHFGNRKLGCLKLYELLRNQDKLTISFSTENLDVEDRLDKFAELLHYFGNVHFDFDSVKPSDYNVAKDLSDYRFDERRNEEDLSGDDEELL